MLLRVPMIMEQCLPSPQYWDDREKYRTMDEGKAGDKQRLSEHCFLITDAYPGTSKKYWCPVFQRTVYHFATLCVVCE